jgi:hypothetical protein
MSSPRDVHDQDAQEGETTERVDVLNARAIEYLAHAVQHIRAALGAQSRRVLSRGWGFPYPLAVTDRAQAHKPGS